MPPEPIASGAFDRTPFAHVLLYLEQKQLSGTLAVWPEQPGDGDTEAQDRILFLKGRPVAGRLVEPAPSLKDGLLRLFLRTQAPYAFYEKNLLGDDRVSGRVDPLALITESLRLTSRDDIVDGVLARVGTAKLRIQSNVDLKRYAFDRVERGLVELLQAEPAALAELAAGSGVPEKRARRLMYLLIISRAAAPYDEEEAARARASRTSGEIATNAAAETSAGAAAGSAADVGEVAAFPEATAEDAAPSSTRASGTGAAVVTPARSAQPVTPASTATAPAAASPAAAAQLPAPVVAPPAATASTARAAPARPAAASDPPNLPPPSSPAGAQWAGRLDKLAAMPSPPEGLSADLKDRWQRIVTKTRLIENQNYFEMLGLEREAKVAEVKAKFFQLAKEWHPDRLPKEIVPLRPYCEAVFGYMSEAHGTLENEEGRKQYLQTLREGGGTPASDQLMQRILDGAMEFERVLVMSRQNRFDEAIDLLERILSVSGDDPDHHAQHAWLLMKRFPGEDAPFERMLAATKRALKIAPDHEKANFYTAQILRRMGKGREALAFFKKVADKNPRNLEAAREVRVASMKSDGGTRQKADKASGGLFGKLFGKKT